MGSVRGIGAGDGTESRVTETTLPGFGVRYEFMTESRRRIAVVLHRSGRRTLVIYHPEDPDRALLTVDLAPDESRTLAEILGASKVAEELVGLQQSVEGLAIDWLPVAPESPYAGRTIGETGARTRTGTSIVAVLREGTPIPAPGPEFGLQPGDTLVVVGTGRGVEDLSVILRMG